MTVMSNQEAITPQNLFALDDESFRGLVDDDLRNESTAEESAALRSPQVVGRWIATLESMRKSVEGQLAAKRSDFEVFRLDSQKSIQDNPDREFEINRRLAEERRRYEKGRAGSLRFKVGVEQQLIAAHFLRDTFNPELSFIRKERDELLRQKWQLEAAIVEHRNRTESEDADQDKVDEALWAVLPDTA